MAYRFKLKNRPAKCLTRIGSEQIGRALMQLEGNATDVAVHEARKCVKRLRALLRLVRPGIGDKAYRRENARFRDVGRHLSGARDHAVLLAQLHALQQHHPEAQAAVRLMHGEITLAGPDTAPSKGRRQDKRSASVADDDIAAARSLLLDAADAWGDVRLSPNAFDCLAEGLALAQRHGRHAFATAYAEGTTVAFHGWRKTVQYHWRHMRLLECGWPLYFQARADEAKGLSEVLGEAQDLALVRAALDAEPGNVLKPRQHRLLAAIVDDRIAALHAAAKPRGERLLAEGPDGLAGRVEDYWHSAMAMTPSALFAIDSLPRSAGDDVAPMVTPVAQAARVEAFRIEAARVDAVPAVAALTTRDTAKKSKRLGGKGHSAAALSREPAPTWPSKRASPLREAKRRSGRRPRPSVSKR